MFEQQKTELGFDARPVVVSILAAVLLLVVAGLIAAATRTSVRVFIYVFSIVFEIAVIRQIVREKQRTRDIRQGAERLRFRYPGPALPTTLPLDSVKAGAFNQPSMRQQHKPERDALL
jgi:hypothetical protein